MGPGPWKLVCSTGKRWGYPLTPDGDPGHLYQTVPIALDACRGLNNRDPAALEVKR